MRSGYLVLICALLHYFEVDVWTFAKDTWSFISTFFEWTVWIFKILFYPGKLALDLFDLCAWVIVGSPKEYFGPNTFYGFFLLLFVGANLSLIYGKVASPVTKYRRRANPVTKWGRPSRRRKKKRAPTKMCWQWFNGTGWQAFSPAISQQIERAHGASSPCNYRIGGNDYEIDWLKMVQRNKKFKTERNIRRVGMQSSSSSQSNGSAASKTSTHVDSTLPDGFDSKTVSPGAPQLLAQKSSGPDWSANAKASQRCISSPSGHTAICTTLHAASVDASRTLDLQHFHTAAMQFAKLFNKNTDAVVQVDVYTQNSFVRTRYAQMKRTLLAAGRSVREIYVFHGTRSDNVRKIMIDGFKVGGEDVVKANGAAYGKGIYTSTQPRLPMTYARNCRSIILSRAFVGKEGKDGKGDADSWTPTKEIRVFRRAEQILPVYVVHYR